MSEGIVKKTANQEVLKDCTGLEHEDERKREKIRKEKESYFASRLPNYLSPHDNLAIPFQ